MLSHRATTSSRHGSTVFVGTVHGYRPALEKCLVCGGWYHQWAPGEPHAVTVHRRGDAVVRLNCGGNVVSG